MNSAEKSGMTIADAEEILNLAGPSYAADHESAMKMLRDTWVRGPIEFGHPNGSLEHISDPVPVRGHLTRLAFIHSIIKNTSTSFNMITGSDYVARMADQFHEMMRRITERGGHANIIVLGGDDAGFKDMQCEFPHSLHSIKPNIKEDAIVRHYFVSDERAIYEEEPHAPLTPDMSSQSIESKFYFRREHYAKSKNNMFDTSWKVFTGEHAPGMEPQPPMPRMLEKIRAWRPFGKKTQ